MMMLAPSKNAITLTSERACTPVVHDLSDDHACTVCLARLRAPNTMPARRSACARAVASMNH